MQKCVEMVTELYTTSLAGSSSTTNKRSRESDASSGDGKGPMGPVFSSLVYEEETQNELEMDAIHACAREREVENLLKRIESGVSVNVKGTDVLYLAPFTTRIRWRAFMPLINKVCCRKKQRRYLVTVLSQLSLSILQQPWLSKASFSVAQPRRGDECIEIWEEFVVNFISLFS